MARVPRKAVDRRALLTSGAAAALLSASGLSLGAAPRGGGHLRVAVDGARIDALVEARLAVFECLTQIAADGTLQEELALSWRCDALARAWTFDLRAGVAFHDGAVLDAGDAAASLRREGYDAEAPGPLTVTIALPASDPHLPYRLASPAMAIGRAGDLASGIGTGLYRQQRMSAGRSFLGQRVARHRKDGAAGWVTKFELIAMTDPAVRAEALRDGYVEAAQSLPQGALRARPDLRDHQLGTSQRFAALARVGLPAQAVRARPDAPVRIAERWWLAPG